MKTHFAKRTLSVLLTVCMLVTSLALPIFAVTPWSFAESTRIYVATDNGCVDVYDHNDEVVRYANLFAREYLEKFGVEPLIIYGAKENAAAHDIILELDPEQGIGSQGYSISIFADQLTVTASDVSGLVYGYRDVLRQLLADGTVEAVANHVPDSAVRKVFLDNGSKYFSSDWIKELIREMSWAGMNTLVTNPNACLTQKQFADIAEYAALYRVEVVSSAKPANSALPQISVAGGCLYIRRDDTALRTPAQMMAEVKPLLRSLAAEAWNDSVSADAWTRIGDAPVIAMPDASAVQALIDEYYNTYLPKENTYTAKTFDAYENEILNAEGFVGLNRFRYNPALFDILKEEILKYRAQLTPVGNAALLLVAMAAYEAKAIEKDKYSPESWSIYESSYIACRNMLAERNYTDAMVKDMAMGMSMIPQFGLIPEAAVAGLRKEGLTSAKFQATTVYRGSSAKMSVVVPRGKGVKDVRVVDENGIVVAYGVAQPINIRKPKQITYIVNIPAAELGTHTYTVYATYEYTDGLLCNFLYCSDPIQCRLTVLE